MKQDFMIEAGVSIECKNCGKRTTVPALRVEPGIKCKHCDSVLVLNQGHAAAKAVMCAAASRRTDVNIG